MKQVMFFLIFFFASNSFQILAQNKSAENLAESFMKALKTKDFEKIAGLMPPSSIYKELSPKETEGKSEKEIAVMVEIAKNRLKDNFITILEEAKDRNIDLNKLALKEVKTEPIPFIKEILYGLELNYSYSNKSDNISLIAINYENNWYLLEIARSVQIFENLDR